MLVNRTPASGLRSLAVPSVAYARSIAGYECR